jgi:hypothetical protein
MIWLLYPANTVWATEAAALAAQLFGLVAARRGGGNSLNRVEDGQ